MSSEQNPERLTDFQSVLLEINSDKKNNPSDSNTQFTINVKSSGGAVDTVKGIAVKTVSMRNQFFNVASYNNKLVLDDGVSSVPFEITPDQYNKVDYINALQASINAAILPDTVVVTLDSSDRLNFVFSSPYGFFLIPQVSTMSNVAGLSETIAPLNNVTLQNPINLGGVTQVYVKSRKLAQGNLIDANVSSDVVDILNIDVPFGAVAYLQPHDLELHTIEYYPYEDKRSLRVIDIALVDQYNNILETPSNFPFNMVVKIYYKL